MSPKSKLVIFDFDGTLFDTHASISHCIKLTFDSLLPSPEQAPSESDIHRLIASGSGLQDTFRALQPPQPTSRALDGENSDSNTADQDWPPATEELWTATYRSLYAQHGQPLIKAFPGAAELLGSLKQASIVTAVVSNKGVAAVVTALANNGLDGTVEEELIVGDKTPGATRKPDLGSFTNVLLPKLGAEKYGSQGLEAIGGGRDVLVVGDTVADIEFAANMGAKSVWCRYGYGDRAACEALGPDYTVDSLADVATIALGE